MPVEHYIYDGQNVLEETDEFGALQASYTYEPEEYGELISQHRDGKTSYYHYDALGSTRQLTDETETVTDSYTYNAWGETIQQTGTTTNPFRWIGNVGYYWDEETQDYYVRARYYQPTIGRWMCIDPIGFVDGMNMYLYVKNQPQLSIDPSGNRKQYYGACCEFKATCEEYICGFYPLIDARWVSTGPISKSKGIVCHYDDSLGEVKDPAACCRENSKLSPLTGADCPGNRKKRMKGKGSIPSHADGLCRPKDNIECDDEMNAFARALKISSSLRHDTCLKLCTCMTKKIGGKAGLFANQECEKTMCKQFEPFI